MFGSGAAIVLGAFLVLLCVCAVVHDALEAHERRALAREWRARRNRWTRR